MINYIIRISLGVLGRKVASPHLDAAKCPMVFRPALDEPIEGSHSWALGHP
jgi:hypothetical protein